MSNYSLAEKLNIIEHSSSLGSLPIDVLPHTQNDEYYFISYSHADYKMVYSDILRLQEKGLNVWYDRGLPPGKNWEKSAYSAIIKHSCLGVIFYLTENSLKSEAVLKEIEFVNRKGKRYLSVNMPIEGQSMPASKMLNAISLKEEISKEHFNIINEFFNEKVLYVDYTANTEFKVDKFKLLKKEDSLRISNGEITSVKDIDLVEIDLNEYLEEGDPLNEIISVGVCAFANCKQLEKINLANVYVDDFAFFGCESLESVNFSRVSKVGKQSFANCEQLKETYIMPNEIGESAFYNCKNLQSVTFRRNVYEIQKKAFTKTFIREIKFSYPLNCNEEEYQKLVKEGIIKQYENRFSFKNNCLYSNDKKQIVYGFSDDRGRVILPSEVEIIGEQAFAFQEDLLTLEVSPNIKVIEREAFRGCKNLHTIVFKGDNSLKNTALKIGENVFADCPNLSKIIFEDGSAVEEIGKSCFYGCEKLKQINFPKKLKKISDFAFSGCSGIEEVIFNDQIECIGDYCFSNCESLQEIDIPASVKQIGNSAFESCSALEKITFKNNSNINFVGTHAFYGTSISEISLPGSIKKFDCNLIAESYYLNSIVLKAGEEIKSIDNSIVCQCSNLVDIFIEKDVKEINCIALQCERVERIVISSTCLNKIDKNLINYLYRTVEYGYETGECFDEISDTFYDADECQLPTIYFAGSKKEWKRIIQTGEFDWEICEDENALIEEVVSVICSDGKI